MTRFDRRRIWILLSAAFLLSGCETISSWFPDKQKQYKYSSEIPPLEIPPDLNASTIEGAVAKRGGSGSGESSEDRPPVGTEEVPEPRPAESESSRPAPAQRSGPTPSLAQSSNDVPLIEIEAPFERAWVEVSKALGRMELEISDQNRSDGVYYVYYGGDKKPYEDRGFFGELAEMFGGGTESSKEYRIKLEDKGKLTTVYVLDSENKPQSSGRGLELLKQLHETLLSESGSGAKPAAAESSKPAP
jgi:outer membrane protein assembly factor BamC